MKVKTLLKKQRLPINREQAWDFFSSPLNLKKITPKHMKIRIQSPIYAPMYPGQIIVYHIQILPFYTTTWVTEITHVDEGHYFVDEQRAGPYTLWHHQHHFKEVEGGIEMTDEVNYTIPLGFLGQIAGWAFVERQVNALFDYRYNVLEKYFSPNRNN